MTVADLIRQLRECDQDAEVFIADIGYRSRVRFRIQRRVEEYSGDDGGVFLVRGRQPDEYPYLPADWPRDD